MNLREVDHPLAEPSGEGLPATERAAPRPALGRVSHHVSELEESRDPSRESPPLPLFEPNQLGLSPDPCAHLSPSPDTP